MIQLDVDVDELKAAHHQMCPIRDRVAISIGGEIRFRGESWREGMELKVPKDIGKDLKLEVGYDDS